jgi:hypothetical protein
MFYPKTAMHFPFPHWYGYFTAWTTLMFEAGALAFIPKDGPVRLGRTARYWCPPAIFGAWVDITSSRAAAESEESKKQLHDPDPGATPCATGVPSRRSRAGSRG